MVLGAQSKKNVKLGGGVYHHNEQCIMSGKHAGPTETLQIVM